jgi:glycerate dehydrogenase
MRGVFLDLGSVHPSDLDLTPLRGVLDEWRLHDSTDPDEVPARIRDAEVVVTNKVPLSGAVLRTSPWLKLICVAATGTNNVDLEAAREHDIQVSNARDYATSSVVEHVFCLMLTLSRRLDRYRQRVSIGDWTRSAHFCVFDETIEELFGKRLGIIGYGVLGRAVSDAARAFSMRVEVAQRLHDEPLPDRMPLQDLLECCDVVSLHCPLTQQTRGLIGKPELRRMRTDALLINAARGGIVDEAALVEALQKGWIAGAGVDVLSEEPPPASNPLLQYVSPRLILTPHVAWASRAARQRLLGEVTENVRSFLQGRARNRVV